MITKLARLESELFTKPSNYDFLRVHLNDQGPRFHGFKDSRVADRHKLRAAFKHPDKDLGKAAEYCQHPLDP